MTLVRWTAAFSSPTSKRANRSRGRGAKLWVSCLGQHSLPRDRQAAAGLVFVSTLFLGRAEVRIQAAVNCISFPQTESVTLSDFASSCMLRRSINALLDGGQIGQSASYAPNWEVRLSD
jgi:hypothetical protein